MDKAVVLELCLVLVLSPLSASVTGKLHQAPRVDPGSSAPSTVLFSDIASNTTDYILKVHGLPLPTFVQWFSRDGSSRWVTPTMPSPFLCTIVHNDTSHRDFRLTIHPPYPVFKGMHVSFFFENDAGFALFHLHIKDKEDDFPTGWLHSALVGASAAAVTFIVLISLITALGACRRRCRNSRPPSRREVKQRNSVPEARPAPQAAPRPRRTASGRAPRSPTGTNSLQLRCGPERDAWSDSDPSRDPLPAPCPCGANGTGGTISSLSHGYINMNKVKECEDHAELAEVITSTLHRFRARARDRTGLTQRPGLENSRRLSRSVPSLFPASLPNTMENPRRRAPRAPMLPPPHTLRGGRHQRCRPPRDSIARDPDAFPALDACSDITSVSEIVRRPPVTREHVLLRQCLPSEDSLGDSDDDFMDMSQKESDKYMTMQRSGGASRLPTDPLKVTDGSVTLPVNGPVYMNLQGLYKSWDYEEEAWIPEPYTRCLKEHA